MKAKAVAWVLVWAVPAWAGAEALDVAVSLLPQAGLVERIGGDRVRVMVLVDEGQDPHSYAPSAKRVTELSRAAVWFTSGMPFEEALAEKLEGRKEGPRVISLGAEMLEGRLPGECLHDHGDEDEEEEEEEEEGEEHEHHHHGDWDPHVWLAPLLVAQQGHLAALALGRLDPEHAAEYRSRAEALEVETQKVNGELAEKLAPLKGSVFYVFHPAFGYFAEAYDLKQVAIESGGREPSAKHLSELTEQARKDGVRVLLTQPQFQNRSAERVAKAIGAELREVDDLGRDVFGTMRTLAEVLLAAKPRG